jgi:class 3 adenylate cyclase/tetratricopeptide (TPR) repeat protein
LAFVCPCCGKSNPLESSFCNQCGGDVRPGGGPPLLDIGKPKSYTPKFLADKILTSRSSIEGERKVVTILSADVAHSTSMSEKLDPEDVHGVMDKCFKLLMKHIHLYEGTINQFLGDGILAIFGAPITHEDHALRACYAALAIQSALAQFGKEVKKDHGFDFKMRIGINTGHVVVGSIGDDLRMDYTAMADTTNIACLLQQVAQPGKILLSENTHRLVKGYFECEWAGKEKFKHRKKPIDYCELNSERLKRSRLDVEEEESGLTGFVDRKKELKVMLDLFEVVKQKEGQAICIVGEAGEGKSRLIHEFKKRIDLGSVRYLESQCISYGKTIPYYPMVEILRKGFDLSESDSKDKVQKVLRLSLKRIDGRLEKSVPILMRLLTAEKEIETLPAEDAERAKEMTFEAIRSLVLSGSQLKPIVIVVENLQWIDTASEQFISYLLQSIASFPVFLILTYRVGYAHPFGSQSYLTQISLSRLSERDSRLLIQGFLTRHRLPAPFVQTLLDKADGNPFYLEEIIKSLIEGNTIVKDSSGYKLAKQSKEFEVPGTIQDIVLARVDRLDENSKRTLQTASVIGREFTLKLLARKEDLERQLERHVRELKQLELVREKNLFPEVEYMFKSAVTKDVVYNSLLVKHRKELHRRIAEAIENIYGERKDDHLEMLAYHYFHSDAIEKAVAYLIKAGDRAKSVYANKEAVGYFQQALQHMQEKGRSWNKHRKEVYLKLGETCDLLGEFDQAVLHYRAGLGLASSGDEKAEALRKIGMVYEKRGNLGTALRSYQEALKSIAVDQSPMEAGLLYMNIGWIYHRNGRLQKALDYSDKALSIFRRERRDYETALVLNNLAVVHELQGQWDLAEKCNKESIRLMEEIGDQRKLGSFYISMGLLRWKQGKLKHAKEYLKKSLAFMEATGSALGVANTTLNLGKVHVSEGNLQKAFSELEKSLAMFEKMGSKSKLCQNYIALGEAHMAQGNVGKAREYCNKAMEIANRVPYPFDQGKIHVLLGEIASGKNGGAEVHLNKGLSIFRSLGRRYEMAEVLKKMGELKMRRGEKHKAEALSREAEGILQELGTKPSKTCV